MTNNVRPQKYGLYDPQFEKDSCGVGFIANIKGVKSHDIVATADSMLCKMEHRGATGAEANTGDGCGMLTALPTKFLRRVAKEMFGKDLPASDRFAAGNVFLPRNEAERAICKQTVESLITEYGQTLIGWRPVPVDPEGANVGPTALEVEPYTEQLFVAAEDSLTLEEFERKLFIIRKIATHRLKNDATITENHLFYVCSLSTKVMIYKGQLTTDQLTAYYPDLRDADYESHLAMVHSRFSTNTFPSWDRAQPFRFMSHNGEINTVRGNRNRMFARQGILDSPLFGDELRKSFPVTEPDTSDSGTFDNTLELLLMSGRSLPRSVMMMIPEAWEHHTDMSPEKQAFYEYHSCLIEPWDGPASIAFTDGRYIGAVLDRNGLRPSRFYVTSDDMVIMASEVGVVNVPPQNIVQKGRLQPGRMFLVDFDQGRIIPDEEAKGEVASSLPYADWLEEHRITLDEIAEPEDVPGLDTVSLLSRQKAFGYTREHVNVILKPMVLNKKEPLGSMGNDTPLAAFSARARMSYDYFQQLFAQVTNPPIDSIREEIIMSLQCYIGPEGNLLNSTPDDAKRLLIKDPILSNEELAKLKSLDHRSWRSKVIDITFPVSDGEAGLTTTLDRICAEASQAIADGIAIIVLSDRATGPKRVPVSALLATGAVHQHLIRENSRTQIGIVLETGEAREVHHHCVLLGFGADAINPYIAFESLWQLRAIGLIGNEYMPEDIVYNYRLAVAKGIRKVMGKMGISTLASYKGAQIFEAVGVGEDVIEKCFTGTVSRIKGVTFDQLAKEHIRRHDEAYGELQSPTLPNPGEYHWRSGGEDHLWNPNVIANLQMAARHNSKKAYKRFADEVNTNARNRFTIRGLLKFKDDTSAIPLEEVEPATEIVKRFVTGAMSLGSISAEAHETLAIAMNRLGGKSNTGEGGEDYRRFEPLPNGDSKRSAIKQVASGRFGVTSWYLTNADELQIKMAQGAKPGEGGELPGHKVSDYIAATRMSTPGVGLISPPPHHDIYSIEDLKQLIHDLKNANRAARISVKLVSEAGVGTVAAGVAKAKADHILVSGHSGGTGASPLTGLKHAGLPWELGIAETHQTLMLNDLRGRVVLQTDGQMKTGRDVVIAALLGAEEVGFSTAPLVTMGCIMMRKCHLNTCPVGVATQNPELRKLFNGVPESVVNYFVLVAEEAREIMAQLGVRTFNELVGRVDFLDTDDAIRHWKTAGIDLSPVLTKAKAKTEGAATYCVEEQDHHLKEAIDFELIELAQASILREEPVNIEMPIRNINRTVGTMLSNEISKAHGERGLPVGTIHIKFNGHAGQSFGAWSVRGVELELEGDANDYVGKGLSGASITVYPPAEAAFVPEDNIIIGNVALYGATSGEAFFRGRAAERFAVRNSGAHAVIEGVGDHGCEYMTGGRVVVLGPTGRNFAAGMSGGVAYVWDHTNDFVRKCNLELVALEDVELPDDVDELRSLIERHAEKTGSTVAQGILDNWAEELPRFVKVMPVDYKRVLAENAKKISLLQDAVVALD